jgi:DNA-binding NarL/FixJ family response regulator
MDSSLIIFAPSNLHRAAWRALLDKQPGIVVSGQATVALLDVFQVRTEFVQQVRTALPGCGLLLLIEEYDLAEIVALLRAGATGFVPWKATVGDLALAIIAAGRGEIVLPPELATQALVALARGENVSQKSEILLTEREVEVLDLLARGLTNKDIAQTLILSVRTVEAHLGNIYGKLDVTSRTEAALWAVNHGYGSAG